MASRKKYGARGSTSIRMFNEKGSRWNLTLRRGEFSSEDGGVVGDFLFVDTFEL